MTHAFDRRTFLRGTMLLPFAAQLRAGAWLPRGDARTLVVLELEGGNDGLNTVIPLDDAAFARLRPRLSAVRQGALPVGGGRGLHASLGGMAKAVAAGELAIVQSVGYPSPDRSHFKSRDIWHAADPKLAQVRADTTGWLGRAADWLAAQGAGLPAADIGGVEVPLVLRTKSVVVPSLRRVEDFVLWCGDGADGDARRRSVQEVLAARTDAGLLGEIAALGTAAVQQSEALRKALLRYQSKARYPETALGRSLQLIARMAISGFGTRLFHVGFGGFDTHARQLPVQQALLRELDEALAAFAADLAGHDQLATTAVLVHSEFGRRVAENESQGTDHGAAAPVFVLGGGVRGGLHGQPPDLDALVDGDVHATADFRSVYRDLLTWLGLDSTQVLGGEFASLGLFAS